MAGPRHALTLRSKGQRCAAGVGMHVDMITFVSSLVSHYYVTNAGVSSAEIFNGLYTAYLDNIYGACFIFEIYVKPT